MYFLAICCPPLAVFLSKPSSLLANIFLCICGGIPGIIHAVLIVKDNKQGKQHKKMEKSIRKDIRRSTRITTDAIKRSNQNIN